MKAAIRLGAAAVLAFFFCLSADGSDWTGFRGPTSNPVSEDKDIPAKWGKENILWKIKLPGLGTSSPITFGDKVFLTSYDGYGTKISKGMGGGFGKGTKGGFGKGTGGDTGGDQKKLRLQVVCLDRTKGEIAWTKEIEPRLPEAPFSGFIRDHGYASSTPVTDGERVYVFFGKTGVFAFGLDGKQLWQADVGSSTDKWGSGTSLVLTKKAVIVNAAVESKSLVALDRNTGKELWRKKGIAVNWTSPVVVELKEGKQEVVLSAPGTIYGLDPDTGKELWTCKGIGGSSGGGGGFGGFGGGYTCSTPAVQDGVIYAMGSSPAVPATLIAVKAGGRGDVTSSHVLWKARTAAGICSPVVHNGFIYWVNGTLTCIDAKTGKTVFQERVYDSRQEYTSAVIGDGKIFALTRFDGLHVLGTGEKFQKLAHNTFPGDDTVSFNSTPAISNSRLYIRSNEYLYCIGKK